MLAKNVSEIITAEPSQRSATLLKLSSELSRPSVSVHLLCCAQRNFPISVKFFCMVMGPFRVRACARVGVCVCVCCVR